eukprot:9738367-Lingulodinium_polyedra.AAC.1
MANSQWPTANDQGTMAITLPMFNALWPATNGHLQWPLADDQWPMLNDSSLPLASITSLN